MYQKERQQRPESQKTIRPFPDAEFTCEHERDTCQWLTERTSCLTGYALPRGDDSRTEHPFYVLANRPLSPLEAAKLGIEGEEDLLGGVVPFGYVGTKAIVHPLLHPDAAAPQGWSQLLGPRLQDVVLNGFTVFREEDAAEAATRLLASGSVRLKPVYAKAGRGQILLRQNEDIVPALKKLDRLALEEGGLVVEENLTNVTTYSIGQIRLADHLISYHGTQHLTQDNRGETVYGGSSLVAVRGGFAELVGTGESAIALAVRNASLFDAAVQGEYPDLLLSRRNYDVARGLDAAGNWRCGVLEQSWRVGGATPAEVAAVEALDADPERRSVRATCREEYGSDVTVPENARLVYRGEDSDVGPLTKFVLIEDH